MKEKKELASEFHMTAAVTAYYLSDSESNDKTLGVSHDVTVCIPSFQQSDTFVALALT